MMAGIIRQSLRNFLLHTIGEPSAIKITRDYEPLSSDSNIMEVFTGLNPDATNWTFRLNESGLVRTKTSEHQKWDAQWRAFRRDDMTGKIIELVSEDGNTVIFTLDKDGNLAAGTSTYLLAGAWNNITSFGTNKAADSNRVPQVRRTGSFLQFRGRVTTSDGLTQAATMFTLPAGLRPTFDGRFVAPLSQTSVAPFSVTASTGVVQFSGTTAAGATFFELDSAQLAY